MINEKISKNFKRHKSKTFDEKDTYNGKVMFYFRKTGCKKTTDKSSSNILIELGGKTLIFSLCSDKLENVSNPSWDFNKFKRTILFLYSQKDLNDSNLTNSNKDSFIQLVNTVDDESDKNKKKFYQNNKTTIIKSNLILSSEKERNKTYNQKNEFNLIKITNKIQNNIEKEKKIEINNDLNKIKKPILPIQNICNICDLLKPLNKLITLSNCNHSLCYNCAKSYYEDLIEMGDFNLKCPYYQCGKKLSSVNFLKNIISKIHYERLTGENNDQTNNKNRNLQLGGKKTISSYNKLTKKSSTLNTMDGKKVSRTELNLILQKYSKNNVLSITKNDDEYLLYTMYRECFCPCCNLPCLFGKTLSNHLKCLNCFKSICKFCFKIVDTDHFNTLSQKCCKNYRIFLWKNKNSHKFNHKRFNGTWENFGLYFVSYIMFVIFLFVLLFNFIDFIIPYRQKKKPIIYHENKSIIKFKNIQMTVLKKKKNCINIKEIFKIIFNFFLKIFFLWIPLFIIIITLPYYPLCFILIEYFL